MRTKPTTVDSVVAFHSKHEQLSDIYYFVQAGELVTVQVREIERNSLRYRRRAHYIDRCVEDTAKKIGDSIAALARACDPLAHATHLRLSYGPMACGRTLVSRTALALNAVDCPDCLIRMYQTSIANPLIGKAIGAI